MRKKDLKDTLLILITGFSAVFLSKLISLIFVFIFAVFIIDFAYSFYGVVVTIIISFILLMICVKSFKWKMKDTLDFLYDRFYISLVYFLIIISIKMVVIKSFYILKEWIFISFAIIFILVKEREKIKKFIKNKINLSSKNRR